MLQPLYYLAKNRVDFFLILPLYLVGLSKRTDFERMTEEKRGLFATIRTLFNCALGFLALKNTN